MPTAARIMVANATLGGGDEPSKCKLRKIIDGVTHRWDRTCNIRSSMPRCPPWQTTSTVSSRHHTEVIASNGLSQASHPCSPATLDRAVPPIAGLTRTRSTPRRRGNGGGSGLQPVDHDRFRRVLLEKYLHRTSVRCMT